jgi:prepilin-type N-terminal cleavage/methylation domain-containing protein
MFTHSSQRTDPGFTLLELLLVVGMMAMIMATIGFNMFSGLAKGRDTRRLQDIKDLMKGLQLSFITDKRYPIYPTEIEINGTDAINTLLLGRGDLVGAIKDPINDSTYRYWYQSSANGTTYSIRFCVETTQVPNTTQGCTNTRTP